MDEFYRNHELNVPPKGPCPGCCGEREWDGTGAAACYHCGVITDITDDEIDAFMAALEE